MMTLMNSRIHVKWILREKTSMVPSAPYMFKWQVCVPYDVCEFGHISQVFKDGTANCTGRCESIVSRQNSNS